MSDSSIQLSVDDEFKSLIPPLSDDEYQRLERSILAEGVRDPIITWNGTIVDGHNRHRICQKYGIRFRITEHEFASRDEAKIWIINNQFARRNLSKYDRSVLALQLESLIAAEAKKRMSDGGNSSEVGRQKSDTPFRTDEQLAKLAGVSRDTIRKVKVIETEAESGNETAIEAREAVRSGSLSIHAAYTEVRPNGDLSDARPICSICGEPIDEGDSYGGRPSEHKSCHNARSATQQYRYPDKSLIDNVAVYSTESLMAELTASVNDMSEAIAESIAINESMGVCLTNAQKNRLNKAVGSLMKAIEAIGR